MLVTSSGKSDVYVVVAEWDKLFCVLGWWIYAMLCGGKCALNYIKTRLNAVGKLENVNLNIKILFMLD